MLQLSKWEGLKKNILKENFAALKTHVFPSLPLGFLSIFCIKGRLKLQTARRKRQFCVSKLKKYMLMYCLTAHSKEEGNYSESNWIIKRTI